MYIFCTFLCVPGVAAYAADSPNKNDDSFCKVSPLQAEPDICLKMVIFLTFCQVSAKALLERSWALFGSSWPPSWPSWRGLGAVLGGSWALLGGSWAALGRSWAVLGRSWEALGRILGALGRLCCHKSLQRPSGPAPGTLPGRPRTRISIIFHDFRLFFRCVFVPRRPCVKPPYKQ